MKKRSWILAGLFLAFACSALAQDRYYTKSGKISFFSKSTLENIEAHNKSVTCVLDTRSGQLQFAVLMKGFEFEKALMQEHFNENYVESHKYPKSEFKGTVVNLSEIDFKREGTYKAKVQGKLSMHGVTREVETTGTITVKSGRIHADANFHVLLADYNISIPSVVKDNIAKSINIRVDCELDPLKNP